MTEINTLLGELPDDIKYQLCFWHCIRAVKTRLSVLGCHPAHYDAAEAFRQFDWIEQEFVLINQMPKELQTEENLKVAQTAIPTLKLHLTGQTSEASADSNNTLESYLDSLDNDKDLNEDPDAVNRWDGPASIFEPGETAFETTATYIFCPAPHRKQLLQIFIRHFCEHPLPPDRAGSTRTSNKI
ncbi:hypothetical protein DFH08DRAFT_979352 [Mycena albidolilacea]|uniref:MULE transposase domain-containing protein n=1 Tax=Mycena albidolilacea TaxID=1033008 RepID=A0AAD7E6I8_9AGAR|nr:hypothetical protein DFH08DRAFT_979352 [Mycena albidolilacea]